MSFQVLMQQRAWRSWPAILEPWLSKIRVFDISVSGELMEQVVLARVEDAGGHGSVAEDLLIQTAKIMASSYVQFRQAHRNHASRFGKWEKAVFVMMKL
jgi:hypothetical protein